MATALSLSGGSGGGSLLRRSPAAASVARCCAVPCCSLRRAPTRRLAASRADNSSPAPFEMTVEGALKLLGVAEGASFDEILRAKNSVAASCKGDQDAVKQVEAAYDMLLMKSLSQRRAGKVVDSSIRYADVKPVKSAGSAPQWVQSTMKNVSVTFEAPSSSNLGIQSSIYGALVVLTYASGTSTSLPSAYTGPDVPGFILATGFGASLYFLTKKNMSLGKAALITAGGARGRRDGRIRCGELAAGRHRALPRHPLPLRRRHRVHPRLAAAGIAVRSIGFLEKQAVSSCPVISWNGLALSRGNGASFPTEDADSAVYSEQYSDISVSLY